MSGPFSNESNVTRRLHELISDHPDFEVLDAHTVDRYCFRYVPNRLADRQTDPDVSRVLDQLNQAIAVAVQGSGVPLMATRLCDQIAVQLPISRAKTSEQDVEAAFETIARWGRLLQKELSTCCANARDMEASYV